jgi:putative nucleotidyltransferase with HDIG domain
MTSMERAEVLMRQRNTGWWDELCEMIPELKNLADTPQPPEHHAEGDVAIHTRLAVGACPADSAPDLLWIALLHDIGKPETTIKQEDGRITAYGHAKRGEQLAEVILARLDMPVDRRRRIVWAIRHHMFHHAWQLHDPDKLTKKQRSYMTNPDFPLLLEFLRIDSAASHGKADGMQAYLFYHQLWTELSRS